MGVDSPYALWNNDMPPTLPDAEHTYMMGSVQYYMKLQVARKELDDMSARQMKTAAKREEIRSRQSYVGEKVIQFKEIVIMCNNYILYNDTTRWEAEKVYREQHSIVLKKMAEIRKLSCQLVHLTKIRDKRKTASLKSTNLQTKIEEALFKSLGLRTMESILKRNSSLNKMIEELSAHKEKVINELLEVRRKRAKMMAKNQTTNLQMGVILSKLCERRVKSTNEVFYYTDLIDRFMSLATDQDIEVGQIRYVTYVMYRSVSTFQEGEMVTEDTNQQLPYIARFIKAHVQIIRELENQNTAEGPTSIDKK